MHFDRISIDDLGKPMAPLTRQEARALDVLVSATIFIGTVLVGGWSALVALLGVGGGYDDPSTAAGWIEELNGSAQLLLRTTTLLAICVFVTFAVAIGGAHLRRSLSTVMGIVCSILLTAALLVVTSAAGQLDAFAQRGTDAVGNTPAAIRGWSDTSAEPALTIEQARADMLAMIEGSLAAASPPVIGQDGLAFITDPSMLRAEACGDSGTRYTAAIDVSTSDNPRSVAAILARWDSADYLADRAMQEDIRYSATMPVERMSILDSTTIDGLVHIDLQSACAVAAGD
ncbi:hypothetical protein [Microbacterium sp. SLBN-146]|uniref:hypothetical protein n=1 Tax=Microbacterium sp. SLBN-146 TaxID=2768457 RepID=UPI00115365E9|nr:hypothetical protein [Microbacterium sp. SLBN-146]